MSLKNAPFTRRQILLGSAAVAAGGVVAGAGPAGASAAGTSGAQSAGARNPAATTALLSPAAALPALAPAEQAYLVLSPDLTPSTSATGGSGIVYVATLFGSYPTNSPAWLGLTATVPVGSLITGIDGTVNGAPRTGSEGIWCDFHLPAGGGFQSTIAQNYFSSGTGVETQSLVINQYFTGIEAFEAYFGGLSATSVARGIRVRYVPPSSGLVPMATTRIYDSGTTPVGTTPVPVQIAGVKGIPTNATAVVVNTEVYQPTTAGYLRVTPYQQDAQVAVQEFAAGQTISNLVIVALNQGKIQAKVSAGTARILMDVSGYFTP